MKLFLISSLEVFLILKNKSAIFLLKISKVTFEKSIKENCFNLQGIASKKSLISERSALKRLKYL
jgi:hypothetical protein